MAVSLTSQRRFKMAGCLTMKLDGSLRNFGNSNDVDVAVAVVATIEITVMMRLFLIKLNLGYERYNSSVF